MANSGSPDRTSDDIIELLKDLLSEGSFFANTVLAPPKDASSYDSLAIQTGENRRELLKRYLGPIAGDVARRRKESLKTTFNDPLVSGILDPLYDAAYSIKPDFVHNVLGQRGSYESVNSFLQASNAIAGAAGYRSGGVFDPHTTARNAEYAANMTSKAFRSFFTDRGTVNVDQLHGLSIPQATFLAEGMLTTKKNYSNWADDKEATKGLTQREIESFKTGTGASRKAIDSFSEYMKKFGSEINGFVASVSKMTGSFEEAVTYLQKATNGRLYESGGQAKELREKAFKSAINMRTIAANAGVKATDLYAVASMATNSMSGLSDLSGSLSLGNIAGAGYGKWLSRNQKGLDEAGKTAAQAGFVSSMEDYVKGSTYDQTVVLADLVDRGVVKREDAMKWMASGDARSVRKHIEEVSGGAAGLRATLSDRRMLEVMSQDHAKTLDDLRATGSTVGRTNDLFRQGASNTMDSAFRYYTRGIVSTVSDKKERYKLRESLERARRESFSQESSLEAAGLSKEDIKDITTRGKNWSIDRVRREVSDRGGNLLELDKAAYALLATRTEDIVNKSSAAGSTVAQSFVKSLKDKQASTYRTVSETDENRIVADQAANDLNKAITTSSIHYKNAANDAERAQARRELTAYVNKGLAGEGGISLTGRSKDGKNYFVSRMIKNATVLPEGVTGDKVAFSNQAEKIFYESLKTKGENEAAKDAEAYLRRHGALDESKRFAFSEGESEQDRNKILQNRQNAFNEAVSNRLIGTVYADLKEAKILNESDQTDEGRTRIINAVATKYRELDEENNKRPEKERLSSESLMSLAFEKTLGAKYGEKLVGATTAKKLAETNERVFFSNTAPTMLSIDDNALRQGGSNVVESLSDAKKKLDEHPGLRQSLAVMQTYGEDFNKIVGFAGRSKSVDTYRTLTAISRTLGDMETAAFDLNDNSTVELVNDRDKENAEKYNQTYGDTTHKQILAISQRLNTEEKITALNKAIPDIIAEGEDQKTNSYELDAKTKEHDLKYTKSEFTRALHDYYYSDNGANQGKSAEQMKYDLSQHDKSGKTVELIDRIAKEQQLPFEVAVATVASGYDLQGDKKQAAQNKAMIESTLKHEADLYMKDSEMGPVLEILKNIAEACKTLKNFIDRQPAAGQFNFGYYGG